MSCLIVRDNLTIASNGLNINVNNNLGNTVIRVPQTIKPQENDEINNLAISSDSKKLALLTTSSKCLHIYCFDNEKFKSFELPRSASKVRFTIDDTQILVADKSGDVLIYNLTSECSGTKLLSHLSLLLDVLQSDDTKFIITSDRDEKIKVSCYPNTYNIQTYCLGHKEFVNHIELLPHNKQYLLSASGDGTIKCWNFMTGKLCHNINVHLDIDEVKFKNSYIQLMDKHSVEVYTLPVVHFTAFKLNESTSVIALTIHSYDYILVYSLQFKDQFIHKFLQKLPVEQGLAALTCHQTNLYVYNDIDFTVNSYELNDNNCFTHNKTTKMFNNVDVIVGNIESRLDSLKLLYKRRFDNVQEYQERKKQRLEKKGK